MKIQHNGGWMVSTFAIVIVLIMSVTILAISTRVILSLNRGIDSYSERQAYWNAHSAVSVWASALTFEATTTYDSDNGWDTGEIIIDSTEMKGIGRTGSDSNIVWSVDLPNKIAQDGGEGLVPGTVYTFTNCGQEGRNGPSQEQVNATYNVDDNPLSDAVTIETRGIQEWRVPADGTYSIEAWGAAAGTNGFGRGGYGATITVDVDLTEGQILAIVVGQMGTGNNSSTKYHSGTGGGGGTFVYEKLSCCIFYYVVAAGGGGAKTSNGNLNSDTDDADGKHDTTSGTTIKSYNNQYTAAGGTNGGGGSNSTRNVLYGGAGAGVNSNGATHSLSAHGLSRSSGWLGGTGTYYGGFGGGGGAGCPYNYKWAGGGGGYSGGGPGHNGARGDGQYGGGGGSYCGDQDDGECVANVNATGDGDAWEFNEGHGKVIITAIGQVEDVVPNDCDVDRTDCEMLGVLVEGAVNGPYRVTDITSPDATACEYAVSVRVTTGDADRSECPPSAGGNCRVATLTRYGEEVATHYYDYHETIYAEEEGTGHTFSFDIINDGNVNITIHKNGSGSVNITGLGSSFFDGCHILTVE